MEEYGLIHNHLFYFHFLCEKSLSKMSVVNLTITFWFAAWQWKTGFQHD